MRQLPPVLGLACMALAASCILNRSGEGTAGAGGDGGAATSSSSSSDGGMTMASSSSSSGPGGMAGAGGASTSSSTASSTASSSASSTASGTGGGGPLWPQPGYAHRRSITIPAGNATGVHNNFPVLISISLGSDPLTGMMPNGDDLLFTDDSHAPLPFELDYIDSNVVLAWVRLPVLDGAVNTTLYVYYDNANPPAHPNPATVWSPNYLAVYHMNENPGPNNAQILDSAGNHDAPSSNSMENSDLVPTIIGDGIAFDGNNERLSATINLSNSFTISMWINPADLEASFEDPSLFAHSSGELDCYLKTEFAQHEMGLLSGNNQPIAYREDANIVSSSWQHVAYRVDVANTTAQHFYNGTALPAGSVAPDASINGTFHIAGYSDWYFNGRIDELHVSTALLTQAWIQTEYDNQAAPQSFISVGPEEAP